MLSRTGNRSHHLSTASPHELQRVARVLVTRIDGQRGAEVLEGALRIPKSITPPPPQQQGLLCVGGAGKRGFRQVDQVIVAALVEVGDVRAELVACEAPR